jgi:hypothetical protein
VDILYVSGQFTNDSVYLTVKSGVKMFEYKEDNLNLCMFNLSMMDDVRKEVFENITNAYFLKEYNNWFGLTLRYLISNVSDELEIFTRV